MEDRAWTFLYFITIISTVIIVVKYVCITLAAKYKMEAERYKCERENYMLRKRILILFL